jgi:hypothetical protein
MHRFLFLALAIELAERFLLDLVAQKIIFFFVLVVVLVYDLHMI